MNDRAAPGGAMICVITARTSSKRLPGKVMLPMLGRPMLWHLIERLQTIPALDCIVIATSTDANTIASHGANRRGVLLLDPLDIHWTAIYRLRAGVTRLLAVWVSVMRPYGSGRSDARQGRQGELYAAWRACATDRR